MKLFNKIFVALGGAAVFTSITGFFQDNGAILGLLFLLFALGGCTSEFNLVITGEGFGTVESSYLETRCTITNGVASGDCEVVIDGETTLTATPASGYLFVEWQGCPNATGNTCEVKDEDTGLDNSITVKAVFDD